jgi:hypothetical protein
VRKPEGKRPLGRLRSRWEDNIKINLKRERMEWYGLTDLVKDRDTVMNL